MQRRRGFQPQMELLPDYRGGIDEPEVRNARADRIRAVLRDPELLRSFIGDIRPDDDIRYTNPTPEAEANARALLSEIADNPKLMNDVRFMGEGFGRNLLGETAETYALRSILGEGTGYYGSETQPSDVEIDTRGAAAEPGSSRITSDSATRAGQYTTELSPAERTRRTPRDLNPLRLAQDIDILRRVNSNPTVLENVFGNSRSAQTNIERVGRGLSDSLRDSAIESRLPAAIIGDDAFYPDIEQVRDLGGLEDAPGYVRNNRGGLDPMEQIRIGALGETPREVVQSLRFLEDNIADDNLDRNAFFQNLSEGDLLPGAADDLDEVLARFDDDYLNNENYSRSQDIESIDPDDMNTYAEPRARNAGNLADSIDAVDNDSQANAGTSTKPAGVQKIAKADLLNRYGRYIPVKGSERKLPPNFINELGYQLRRGLLNVEGPDNDTQRAAATSVENYLYGLDKKIADREVQPEVGLRTVRALGEDLGRPQKAFLNQELDKVEKSLGDQLQDVDTTRAGVGGGEYLTQEDAIKTFPNAAKKIKAFASDAFVPEGFEENVFGTFDGTDGDTYDVQVYRRPSYSRIAGGSRDDKVSRNFMQMLEDKPFAGEYDIGFKVRNRSLGADFDYSQQGVPDDVAQNIMKFVSKEGLAGIPGGAIVRNDPLDDTDKSGSTRSTAYQRSGGFGGNTDSGQFSYIDPDTGEGVPIQPTPQGVNKARRASPMQNRGAYLAGLPIEIPTNKGDLARAAVGTQLDVLRGVQALREVPGNIKAAPMSLAPGAMDLVPSREAIKAGYEDGAIEMGKQMGKDFLVGIPTGAAAAAVLSRPGMKKLRVPVAVGSALLAGGEALDEVVKQETGKGIGERVVEATPDAVKTRLAKAKEVFNPLKGEFGLSELLTGR